LLANILIPGWENYSYSWGKKKNQAHAWPAQQPGEGAVSESVWLHFPHAWAAASASLHRWANIIRHLMLHYGCSSILNNIHKLHGICFSQPFVFFIHNCSLFIVMQGLCCTRVIQRLQERLASSPVLW